MLATAPGGSICAHPLYAELFDEVRSRKIRGRARFRSNKLILWLTEKYYPEIVVRPLFSYFRRIAPLLIFNKELTLEYNNTLRNIVYRSLLACLLTVGAAPSGSAAPRLKDTCAGSANEVALLACRQVRLDRSDSELKTAIGELEQNARQDEPELAKALSASQAAWLTYRETECRVRTYESHNGSAFKTYWLACMSDLNRVRLRDLRLLQNQP